MLRSTADWPASTSPSAAIRSPGRTTNRWPARSREAGTHCSRPASGPPSDRTHTSLALAAARSRMACPALREACASYSRPASRNVVTEAATSR